MTQTGQDDWSPLSTRDQPSGEDVLYEGVPEHLFRPLTGWLLSYLGHARSRPLAERVALRLRIALPASSDPAVALLANAAASDRLFDVIDTAIHLDDALRWQVEVAGPVPNSAAEVIDWIPATTWPATSHLAMAVETLQQIMIDGGSAYRVDWDQRCLSRRLSPVVQQAVQVAINAGASPNAHLRAAWTAAYGVHPDPAKAYDEAVRAVEAAAIPLVLPSDAVPTLGKVRAHFADAPHKWRLAIEGNSDGDIAPLTSMISLLWNGHSPARHAGSPSSRAQRQDEAEMAVHLAATLVQWFKSGAIRGRQSSLSVPQPGE